MRRSRAILGVLAFMAGIAESRVARAVTNGSWVYNGSTVSYLGANALRIGTGEVNVNNAAAQLPGTNITSVVAPTGAIWADSGTVCPANNQNLLTSASPFYVYFYPAGVGVQKYILSAIPPTEIGQPSNLLFWKVGGVCNGILPVNFVFLGSFITDNNTVVVPFARFGDRVQFIYNEPQGTNFQLGASWVAPSASFHGFPGPFPMPVTASALDLSYILFNHDTDSHTVYVLNNTGSVAGCATGTQPTGASASFEIPPLTQPALNESLLSLGLGFGTGAGAGMQLAVCDTVWGVPGGNVALIVYYRGYTETVHHLDFVY